jgi:hypothetical protein
LGEQKAKEWGQTAISNMMCCDLFAVNYLSKMGSYLLINYIAITCRAEFPYW